MKIIILFLAMFITILGCSKMQDKKTTEENKTSEKQNTITQGTDTNTMGQKKSQGQKDEKAEELVKAANDAIALYANNKSDGNKKEVIATSLEAANYLMLEANLPAKEKYRPALKYYRKVLELDPKNEQALVNKKQIEDIYESMGMPIPQ